MTIESGYSRRRFFATAAIAAALTVAGGLGCVSPPPPTESIEATLVEAGEDAVLRIDQIVMLLDASGSMAGASRFLSTRNLAASFVAGMPEGGYAGTVVTFGGNASEIFDFASFNRDDMDNAVGNSELLGKTTDIPAVLAEVQGMLAERAGVTAIVLFSDGKATRHGRDLPLEQTLAAANRLVEKTPGEVCFYTIASGDDRAGMQLMQSLAAVTACGRYRHADSLTTPASLHEFEQSMFVNVVLPSVVASPVASPPEVALDRDRDGVDDDMDRCPDTPTHARVNELGCWVLNCYAFDSEQFRIRDSQNRVLDDVVDEVADDVVNEVADDVADEVAAVLEMNPNLRIRIDGHTDSTGSPAFNQTLSERRADAVRRHLEARGIDGERLTTRGFGMNSPLAGNDTPEGMAKNRRCQMTFLK